MKNDNLNILLNLIKSQCYEYRNIIHFKLSSGTLSNHYFDCRPLLSSPNGFYYVGSVMADILIKQILNNKTYPTDIKAVGGMAVGSISVSNAIVANLLYTRTININTFYVRKTSKDHGKSGRTVGIVNTNDNIIIVDDVITTGHSIQDAIETVQEERAGRVVAVLVLIDREEGGKEDLIRKFNIPIISAFTTSKILIG